MPNALLFAGTGGAGVPGACDSEYGMRASASELSRAKQYEGAAQKSRMPSRSSDQNAQWRERVAELLRAAQRSCGTPAPNPFRKGGDAR
ncbi:MAG: hypothetical protein ABI877_22635 [Gemmatimonadaceae bacterium]